MIRRNFLALAAGGLAFGASQPARGEEFGPVTHLPIPRFVSLKGNEGNARRGPSLTQRIDWVFTREGMPLKLTGEFEHWRRVEDHDGLGGWIHYTLISGLRTVIVVQPQVTFYALPDTQSPVIARAEQNVIARLHAARKDWCRVSADANAGWVQRSGIWGVLPNEMFG